MFLDARMEAEIIPMAITGREIVQSGRFKVVPSLPLADTFKSELLNFQVEATPAALEVFETGRSGTHDDLVMAVALPLQVGERRKSVLQADRDDPGNLEVLALAADHRRVEAAARRWFRRR
jgi:hypothetical protein